MRYAEQYQQIVREFMADLSDDAQAAVKQNFNEIMSADHGDISLNQGASASDFILANLKGEHTLLSTLLEEGPVVVNFYRGDGALFVI